RVTDASKVALAHTVARLSKAGVALFDVQFVTPHLARCGAYNIPRKQYLQRVAQLRDVGLNLVSIPETSEHLV
ncbi:MAG TPA: hypothetical protein VL137_07105, partial [Polyangiaceae bacterium]|nr:hypothetical protein [Polyangiaceae bacterium]